MNLGQAVLGAPDVSQPRLGGRRRRRGGGRRHVGACLAILDTHRAWSIRHAECLSNQKIVTLAGPHWVRPLRACVGAAPPRGPINDDRESPQRPRVRRSEKLKVSSTEPPMNSRRIELSARRRRGRAEPLQERQQPVGLEPLGRARGAPAAAAARRAGRSTASSWASAELKIASPFSWYGKMCFFSPATTAVPALQRRRARRTRAWRRRARCAGSGGSRSCSRGCADRGSAASARTRRRGTRVVAGGRRPAPGSARGCPRR